MRSPFKDISKKKEKLKKAEKDASSGYALRSHSNSPDALSLKPSSSITETNFITTSTQSSPVPALQTCLSCQSADTNRKSNLVEVVKVFTSKLEDFKILSSNLIDSTKNFDQAVKDIKNFIVNYDSNNMDNFMSTFHEDIESVKGNLADLNNYIVKLDDIEDIFTRVEDSLARSTEFDVKIQSELTKIDEMEKFIHAKLDHIDSITYSHSKDTDNTLLQKITNLEQLCIELNEKVDNSNRYSQHRNPQLEELEELINAEFNSLKSPSSTDSSRILSRISKVEEICNDLNIKMDSFTNHHPPTMTFDTPHMTPITRQEVINNDMPYTQHNKRHQAPNHDNPQGYTTLEAHASPRDCLILGDSNSKYININTNHIRTKRIPTYRIEDINPEDCVGYSRIWIHVGINDLKTRNCRGPADIHTYHSLLLHKLHQIRLVCPNSKLIVSPILPTGVPALNERARLFTNLLYRGPQWFELLDFRVFCGNDDSLIQRYRCYGNPYDRIHLGRAGIELLKDTLVSRISKVDTRSYSTVLQTGHAQNHRT